MQEREGEQQERAPAREVSGRGGSPASPQQAVLELQQGAGNAAVGRMIQRWSPLPDWMPTITDPLAGVFEGVIQTNRAMATRIPIPPHYVTKLFEYARANPLDGAMLLPGYFRDPWYYNGGWILDVQTNAKAMTLDDYVFVDGDLDIGTYIHEMVHVTQYAALGRTRFLVSYFGLSAATIAKRFIMREPINMMRSSPHENQAYDLEQRFLTWYAANP
ncbi:MAG: hypothetical protein ACRDPV_01635 [Gaiellaceae bacterium]